MGNSADGSSNLARFAKKKKRKKENSLRSESDFIEKDNPNQKTDKKQRASLVVQCSRICLLM